MRTLFVLLAVSCAAFAVDPPRDDAPRFRGKTIDGATFDNESLKGRWVLIQFWTTWCGYCRRDQPFVDELAKDYPENKLTVLAVSVGESRGKVKDYMAKSPRASKVVVNEDTNLPAVFRIDGFPSYFILDPKGRIAARQDGAGGPALREMLRKLGLEQR